jgi:hypothetical protein
MLLAESSEAPRPFLFLSSQPLASFAGFSLYDISRDSMIQTARLIALRFFQLDDSFWNWLLLFNPFAP